MATLAQLRSRVQTRHDRAIADTVVDELVNEALMESSQEFDWPWLITHRSADTLGSNVDSTTYTFPTGADIDGAYATILAVYVNDQELPQVAGLDSRFRRDARQQSWAPGGDGDLVGADGGAVFTIRPAVASGATVTVSWKQSEKQLSGDSDTTLCPDWFAFGPVVTLAVAKGHLMHPDESNPHAFWMRDYERQIRRAATDRRRSRGPLLPRSRVGTKLSEV